MMQYKPNKLTKVDGAHSDNIWSMCWTSQGKIVTGSLDGTVKIWSVKEDGSEIHCDGVSGKQLIGITSLTPVSDGSIVLACYQDSTIRMFSTDNMTEISEIDPGLLEAYSIAVSPSDDIVVSGNRKGEITMWSMLQGHEKMGQLETGNDQFILDVTFNLDGRLASSSVDGMVHVFDIETKQVIHKIDAHATAVRSIEFTPDGNILLIASDDRQVSAYDMVGSTVFHRFSQHGMVRSIDTSQNRRHFVVGCSDGSIAYWDLGMQKRLTTFESHKDQVWCVGFDKASNHKTRFSSAGDDGMLQLYE